MKRLLTGFALAILALFLQISSHAEASVGPKNVCAPGTCNGEGATPTPGPTPSPAIAVIQAKIIAGLNKAFPSAANSTTEIYFSGNYALANWMSGEQGGCIVFVLSNGVWAPLFGGAGMVDQSTLTSHGVPSADASALLAQIP